MQNYQSDPEANSSRGKGAKGEAGSHAALFTLPLYPFAPLPLYRRLLLIVVAVAILFRVGSAVYQGDRIEVLPGVYDQVSYHELALRVLDGHGFTFATGWWPATPAGQPTAHWSYLYVLFLAGTYAVFGPHPLAARLIQAVLAGIIGPILAWRLGKRLFNERVGLVTAAIFSGYGYFVFYAGALVTETFYILTVLGMLDIAVAIGMTRLQPNRRGLWPWVLLGVAAGLAALLRQLILLLVPVILAYVIWRVSFQRPGGLISGLRGGLVTLAVLAVLILPWTIRNYQAFGRFVLLNTNAGFAFFWGNHPIHGTEFIPILKQGGRSYGSLIPRNLRGRDEAETDRLLLKQGLQFVTEDPARYIRLSFSRIKEYFKFWPSADSGRVSNLARVLSFGFCLPFLLGGLGVALMRLLKSDHSARSQQSNCGITLILIFSGLYTLVHLLTWTLVRYRLPVDAVTMPFVALGLISFVSSLARRLSHLSSGRAPARRNPATEGSSGL